MKAIKALKYYTKLTTKDVGFRQAKIKFIGCDYANLNFDFIGRTGYIIVNNGFFNIYSPRFRKISTVRHIYKTNIKKDGKLLFYFLSRSKTYKYFLISFVFKEIY